MRTLKNGLILLLTLGVIALGAALPNIVAAVMNRETGSQSGTREMAPIALDMDEEEQILSAFGKIALLKKGATISVTENEAAMTTAEVNAAVEAAMAEYIEAGVFEWFEYTSWITQPYLCADLKAPNKFYSLFWSVTIINEKEPFQTLLIDIDDETGQIYSIRYDTYGEYSLKNVWERNAAVMDGIVPVYLSQLGLMERNAEPYLEYGELDGEVLCGTFCASDAEYGEMFIEFYVTGSGSFWVYFP